MKLLYFIPREIERNPPAAIGLLLPTIGVGRGPIDSRHAEADLSSARDQRERQAPQRPREHRVARGIRSARGQIAFGPAGASIAVQFALPVDALETTAAGRRAGVFWSLSADAELPGVNLNEDFDIPVRRTGEAPHLGMQSTGRSGTPYYELRDARHRAEEAPRQRDQEQQTRVTSPLERPGLPSVGVDDRALTEGGVR